MKETIRTLFSRKHEVVIPKQGVFLAGPTPPNGSMTTGWRRAVINALKADERLHPGMMVVSPEPETGNWADIDNAHPANQTEAIQDKQIPWEWQYLNLCDITAFWLPTYWTKEKAGVFAPNIGPTSRWEYGYFLQEYIKNPDKRRFIVGGPEDADSIKWAKKMADVNGVPWHTLKAENKSKLVADSFVKAIADALVDGQWGY
ncbi:nucleoside 2-deoxyribosyltransferase domain-containing protein [Microscilla marina]|uniref:Uncharacterized protein n=1 Tax=Microscilla marina ATCC 23134 TaxID=313606 RepID=A1ZHT0_MICM2|nr:nucleoside 2-deoxyribosyltransferase domain-containing protein [Microscilla marina]EAY30087.1 hypothetical protein M23134_05420 [Microscilla marina ATCC 23134]